MSMHLSEEKLLDLLDGAGEATSDGHLRSCEACRARLDEARAGLGLALGAEVPEPSSLYWETFHRQVGRRLVDSHRPWGRWLWPALGAVAAGLVMIALPHRAPDVPPPAPRVLAAWSPLPAAADDPGLEIVESVALHLGPEAECGGLDDCVADLSDEESGTLAALLRNETRRRPS
jgi:hypothetical protein